MHWHRKFEIRGCQMTFLCTLFYRFSVLSKSMFIINLDVFCFVLFCQIAVDFGPVTSLKTDAITSTSWSVSWSAPQGECLSVGYKVQYAVIRKGQCHNETNVIFRGHESTWKTYTNLTGLNPYSAYVISVEPFTFNSVERRGPKPNTMMKLVKQVILQCTPCRRKSVPSEYCFPDLQLVSIPSWI